MGINPMSQQVLDVPLIPAEIHPGSPPIIADVAIFFNKILYGPDEANEPPGQALRPPLPEAIATSRPLVPAPLKIASRRRPRASSALRFSGSSEWRSPEEIALAVMAQIVAVRNGR
jgi:hypothetical protein